MWGKCAAKNLCALCVQLECREGGAHHLECTEGGTVMHRYTDVNYLVKKLLNHGDQVHKEVSDSKSVGVKVVKNGIFVIVPNTLLQQAKRKVQKTSGFSFRCR